MKNHAIVVEGAHDASFIGRLLEKKGFINPKNLNHIPDFWRSLIPTRFPADGMRLDRVVRFPDVHIRDDLTVGVITSGSDSRLISALRGALELLGPENLSSVGIFADVDTYTPQKRFNDICRSLAALNATAAKEGVPGFPINVPEEVGVLVQGTPRVGVFLFPDNIRAGALETILLECSDINHPELSRRSQDFVTGIQGDFPADASALKRFRSGMGMSKSAAGIIANLLSPGTSLAVSLFKSNWLAGSAFEASSVKNVELFIDHMLTEQQT